MSQKGISVVKLPKRHHVGLFVITCAFFAVSMLLSHLTVHYSFEVEEDASVVYTGTAIKMRGAYPTAWGPDYTWVVSRAPFSFKGSRPKFSKKYVLERLASQKLQWTHEVNYLSIMGGLLTIYVTMLLVDVTILTLFRQTERPGCAPRSPGKMTKEEAEEPLESPSDER